MPFIMMLPGNGRNRSGSGKKYQDLIISHYRTPDPNALVMGHCNITQNRILEIIDRTGSNLLETFGTVREEFFMGLSSLVVDEQEREEFLGIYLNRPSLEAFRRGGYPAAPEMLCKAAS